MAEVAAVEHMAEVAAVEQVQDIVLRRHRKDAFLPLFLSVLCLCFLHRYSISSVLSSLLALFDLKQFPCHSFMLIFTVISFPSFSHISFPLRLLACPFIHFSDRILVTAASSLQQ
jgi:hypothetical protein